MTNFNTYQTRQFYVAKKFESTLAGVNEPGDIYVGAVPATGAVEGPRLFFSYCNADGLVTRSDTIPANNIVHMIDIQSSALDRPLTAHEISVDTTKVTLANLIGKTLNCIITIHEYMDYDASNTRSFVASVVGDSTNTASVSAFNKALAEAIAFAMPRPDKKFPLIKVYLGPTEITPAVAKAGTAIGATEVTLVEGLQKYVRGKLSGEPCPFSVAFKLSDGNTDDIVWGKETITSSEDNVYPGVYSLADLEYFALGERGDVYRGSTWPNNYDPTYMIDLSQEYAVLNLEYFWQGGAENVQKSPRMIQIAGPQAVIASIKGAVTAAIGGGSKEEGGEG